MDYEAKSAGPRPEVEDPFPQSGLGALLVAAATDTPDAALLCDDDGDLTASDVAARVAAIAIHLRDAGLAPGERALIVAGTQAAAIVALGAALRAGLEPALVPVGLGPVELAAHARAVGAAALVGPSTFGTLALGDAYLSAASVIDTIRVIATWGPDTVDGAIDLRADAAASRGRTEFEDAGAETPVILTFQGGGATPMPIAHRQAALFADALSLVEQARINPSRRIISTLPPATAAGLVAGPFAALIGASGLTLQGPFAARAFLAACDRAPGFHVVAPCAMGVAFEEGALSAEVASLILVSRFAGPQDFTLPPPLACDRPIVDLYALGEETLLARRRTDGEARPPVRVTDKSLGGGLGAQLNRARADIGLRPTERP